MIYEFLNQVKGDSERMRWLISLLGKQHSIIIVFSK